MKNWENHIFLMSIADQLYIFSNWRNIIISNIICNFSSVAQLCLTLCDPVDCSMPGFDVHQVSNAIQPSHPLSPPFSSCFQSFPALGSFPMNQFFASGGQSIGVSASALVLPMNIQDWYPLRLTGLISLQSKGLPRVFSNTTVQKHQFFCTQLYL